VALCTAAICGCTSELEEQISELAKARQCWGMTRTRDYSFDLQTKCFGACYGPVTVEVTLGDVVSVTPHEGVTSYRDSFLGQVPRIGELFDRILRYIERSSQDGVELEVTYDSVYGYPRSIVFRNNNVTDTYFEATVENVKMKQPSPADRYECDL
jgi:hypothetical protein